MDDNEKLLYHKKIDAVFNAELDSDLALCLAHVDSWLKAKPDSKPIAEFRDTFINIYSKIHMLRMERDLAHRAISDYRSDKLRAVERARKAEKEIEENG
jgi:hypothetical protein|tara:strand:+ start:289 stop:585 length:297 start_codon:yes stop_codon:yes gene_type:complete